MRYQYGIQITKENFNKIIIIEKKLRSPQKHF